MNHRQRRTDFSGIVGDEYFLGNFARSEGPST